MLYSGKLLAGATPTAGS